MKLSDSVTDLILGLGAICVALALFFLGREDSYDNAYGAISLVIGIVWLLDWSADES
jgi:hypothetical protein